MGKASLRHIRLHISGELIIGVTGDAERHEFTCPPLEISMLYEEADAFQPLSVAIPTAEPPAKSRRSFWQRLKLFFGA